MTQAQPPAASASKEAAFDAPPASVTENPSAQPSREEAGDSAIGELKGRAVKSTAWVMGGYVLGQGLRLGSNLLLTRLLAPELFGLMAIVHAFLTGFQMFSDVGLGPSIIHSKSGRKQSFLDTAWTLQVVRGGAITAVACLIAPLVGSFYDESALVPLLMASALGALAHGFSSTAMFTVKRDLLLARLTVLELAAQAAGVAVAITWALLAPSVWALVASSVVTSVVIAGGSHVFLPSHSHRFRWDQESVHELVRFGRWIFIGTVCGFFANHADRLVVGKLFTMAQLGTYSIALMMVKFVEQMFVRFNRSVLFPVYAAARRQEPQTFPSLVRRTRFKIVALGLALLLPLITGGDFVVQILFDPRYADAGWMLRILALAWLVEMCLETGPAVLAHGDSLLLTKVTASRSLIRFACMLVGGIQWGPAGLIWGLVISRFISYPLIIYSNRKYDVWFPGIDALALGTAGALGYLMLQLRDMAIEAGLLGSL